MAAISGSTIYRVLPNLDVTIVGYLTPNTADSNDTLDVSGEFSTVVGARAWDFTTGDAVTASFSGTTITIDASGGTTNKVYYVEVFGSLLKK